MDTRGERRRRHKKKKADARIEKTGSSRDAKRKEVDERNSEGWGVES